MCTHGGGGGGGEGMKGQNNFEFLPSKELFKMRNDTKGTRWRLRDINISWNR